jgi:hypothetical protein
VAITRVGSLPVSAINVGLAGSVAGFGVQAAKLQADITKLGLSGIAQGQVALNFPPNPLSYAGAATAALSPALLASILNPITIVGGSVDAALDVTLDLAIVTAQLAVVESLAASFSVGIESGGIAGWSYAGHAAGFGTELDRYTVNGFGKTPASAEVQAVIITTEDFDAWGAFSQSVNTGGTANATADANLAQLAYLGELSGGRWNSGVARLSAKLKLFVAELRGRKSSLEASLEFMLGLDLPDPTVVVDAGLSVFAEVGIDGLLDNMVNVRADLAASIGTVQGKLDLLLDGAADVAAQLSAGGLTFWTYSGTAGELGAALRSEIAGGIPGGSGPRAPAYGLALAGAPGAMTLFGTIFKTS